MRTTITVTLAALFVAASPVPDVSAGAQWLKYPTAGVPKTADGRPNLNAPAPRAADGKPDLPGSGCRKTIGLARRKAAPT